MISAHLEAQINESALLIRMKTEEESRQRKSDEELQSQLGVSVWTGVAEGISGREVLAWMNLRDDKGVNREDYSWSRPIT